MLFNNPKKVVWLIVTFVSLFVAALATKCHASEPSFVTFRGGSTYLRGVAPVVQLNLSTPVVYGGDNPYTADARFEYSITLIGSSEYHTGAQANQISVSWQYVDGFGPVDLGLGLTALQHEDAYNSGKINFMLMVGCHHRQFSVRLEHISNAGTQPPNLGRDFLLLGWSFK